MSPIEQANRSRNPSISFDPRVTFDSGKHRPLRSSGSRYSSGFESNLSSSLPQKEMDQIARESNFGGLGESFHRSNSSNNISIGRYGSTRRRQQSAAHKFLQQASPILTEGVASLTSESTMSPMSEFHTPPQQTNSMGGYFPTDLTQSPSDDSLQSLSPWPQAAFGMNKSLKSNRSRSRSQHSRKAFSERSNSCSAGISPASMFLNSMNNSPLSSQIIEPDSEGQEVGSYVLGKQIGHGGFSTVKEAYTLEDNSNVKRAVKIVRKRVHDFDTENDRVQASFEHEVSLWRILNHPNILPLVAVYDTPFATFAFMKLNTTGTLFDLVKNNRQGISASHARRYGFQLACALRYLHEDMRIVHGDVKLENCLLDTTVDTEEGGNILLCDFGLSTYMKSSHDEDEEEETRKRENKKKGTPDSHCITGSFQYAAPELIKASEPLSSPGIDVWAFGIMMYALHTGMLPFNHSFAPKLQMMILSGEWNTERVRECWGLAEAGSVETSRVMDVLKGCLCKNPEKRWSIRDILDSPWLEGCGGDSP
ncbi:kinase-like domain-containing protein [Geopyxis carbonaria]|nr:kinase-like domain-containing protein [Geopyxis carbonaria]